MAPFSPFRGYHPRGKNCGGTPKKQVVNNSPYLQPLDSARHAPRRKRGYKLSCFYAGRMMSIKSRLQLEMVGGQIKQSRPGKERPLVAFVCRANPVLCVFSCELACERARP